MQQRLDCFIKKNVLMSIQQAEYELYSGYKSNIWMLKSTLCVAFKECNEQVGLGKSYSKRSTITIQDCTTVINSKFLVISTLQSQITIEER